jgi:hypothetical protein
MNTKTNTTTTAAVPTVPSLEQFTLSLTTRAAKDPAALAMLCDITGRARLAGYTELLQSFATRTKTTLSVILTGVSEDDIDALKRTLPKDSPQRAAIVEALKSIPTAPTTTIVPAGSKTYKDGTSNAETQLTVTLKGTSFRENHGAAWWKAFLTVIEHSETMDEVRHFVENH